MPETVLVGMAVTSHSGLPGRISYDNLSIESLLPPDTSSVCTTGTTILDRDFVHVGSLVRAWVLEGAEAEGKLPSDQLGVPGRRLGGDVSARTKLKK